MSDREYYIGDIRARIPYLSDRHLRLVDGFIRGFHNFGYSNAEAYRVVLSEEKQKQADTAALAMMSLGCAASRGEAFGVTDNEVIIADCRRVSQIYREAGWGRISRNLLIQYMEDAGYIIHRASRPKTATIGNTKCEVIYIPVEQFAPFEREAAHG